MKYNFYEINTQYPITSLFTALTGVDVKLIGEDCFEPEDKICPLCGHKECFRLYLDSYRAHCFSCDENLSVLDLVLKLSDVPDIYEAARILTEGQLSPSYAMSQPEQELGDDYRDFTLMASLNKEIAEYYHNNLLNNEEALSYQIDVRGHSLDILKEMQVGYSDGRMWQSFKDKYQQQDLLDTGMFRLNKAGELRDFAPAGIYVYPHMEVSSEN
ncbi:hypothetical protein [Serratia fonticola]|uniref:hypothetical protein n=1 Tax=Serratia fonticola TaxID=47917 RepID=UPI0021ADABA6|nr:hypothetical protein [Serratia fonticola]